MFEASIPRIMSFFTEIFKSGAKYGTLNSYRSALSILIGERLGSDDRIARQFKGFYRLRPPAPKYDTTWDPSIVLDFLSILTPNKDIHLEHLTKKTVTLLALITAHRVQTLSKINIKNIEICPEVINIKIPDILKTSRLNASQPNLNIPFFRQRPEICPADTLLAYIEVTRPLRTCDNLFISFKSPHKAVTSQTLSRWIKNTLFESGIDTSIFSAHSTRHASTSAAHNSGVNIDLIRKTAGWSGRSNVFARFYKRNVSHENPTDFANSILN